MGEPPSKTSGAPCDDPAAPSRLRPFASELVDRIRASGNVWNLPGGQLELPGVFGFCRGVEHALAMLTQAVADRAAAGRKLHLLGEIIHNPWVNEYFKQRGVRILTEAQRRRLSDTIGREDCAVIPAFGVPLEIERELAQLGCEIVDTSCGDVRRLWRWAEQAVRDGYAVLIYGRARHDETVVTKSRLAAAGGKYLVVGNLDEAEIFCRMITRQLDPAGFVQEFGPEVTNAQTIEPFEHLAQVSQTTMLYGETMELRERIGTVFAKRFGREELTDRLLFHPTVCRATQQRQSAAVELCSSGPDLAIVVGGFSSSNTQHLYELACRYVPAYLIEDADAIRSASELLGFGPALGTPTLLSGWLPSRRPVRIAVLAGASCPEIVVGQVLQRLASFLSP